MSASMLVLGAVVPHLEPLLKGVPTTVVMTVAAFTLGAVLAVPLTAGGRSRFVAVRFACRFVVDLIRSVPPLVWLFVLFYGLAENIIQLSPFTAGVLGLGLVTAGYVAEIYKAGLLAVPRAQWEAGHALGLGRVDIVRWIVGPQAFRIILPGAGVWALTLLKETAVVSIVGSADIAQRAVEEQQQSGQGLDTFIAAAVLYIGLSIPIAVGTRLAYRRMLRLRAAQ